MMTINKSVIEKICEDDDEIIIKIINEIIDNSAFEYENLEKDVEKAFQKTVSAIKKEIEMNNNDNKKKLRRIDLNEDILKRKIDENDYPNFQKKSESES